MTERDQLVMTPRNLLLRAVRKELDEFERREIEFRRKDREGRAAELRLPRCVISKEKDVALADQLHEAL